VSCEAIRAELDAYLDGELEEEQAAGVARHLAGCAECRRQLEERRAVAAAVRRLAPPAAPPQFLERFRAARLQAAPPASAGTPRRTLRLSLAMGGALAAAAALFFAVSLTNSDRRAISAPRASGAAPSAASQAAKPSAGKQASPLPRERDAAEFDAAVKKAPPAKAPSAVAVVEEKNQRAENLAEATPPPPPAPPKPAFAPAAPAPAPAPPAAAKPAAGEFGRFETEKGAKPTAPADLKPPAERPVPGAAPAPGSVSRSAQAMREVAPLADEARRLKDDAEVAGKRGLAADRRFAVRADSADEAVRRLGAIARSLGGSEVGHADELADADQKLAKMRKAEELKLKLAEGALARQPAPPAPAKPAEIAGAESKDKEAASRTVVLELPADRLEVFEQALAAWTAAGDKAGGGGARKDGLAGAVTLTYKVAGAEPAEADKSLHAEMAADALKADASRPQAGVAGPAGTSGMAAPAGPAPTRKKVILVVVTIN